MNNKELAKMIDHTLLKPEAKEEDVKKLCEEALEYNFASVCVNPTYVPIASEMLKGSDVKVCTVIGFPLGANSSQTKAFESGDAIKNGAEEVDMVINIGAVKSGQWEKVENDIKAVVESAKDKALVKVILETCLLTDDEKVKACECSVKAGADFVKTSTGFSKSGATIEDVKLMRQTVGKGLGVKASGGVRDREGALSMIEAGATRIGASSGIKIVTGGKGESGY